MICSKNSAEVRELVQRGKLRVVGAVYDLESGQVSWLGAHPEQTRLLTYSGGDGHGEVSGHITSQEEHPTTGALVAGAHEAPESLTMATAPAPAKSNHLLGIIGGAVTVLLLGWGIHLFSITGMKNWTVGRRIAAGFGLVLAILTLVGVVAYEGFHATANGFGEYRTDARHSVLAAEIEITFLEMRIAAKDFDLTKHPKDVTIYNSRKATLVGYLAEAEREIKEPARAQMIKTIEGEVADHATHFSEIVTLARQPGSAARIKKLNAEMSEVGNTINEQLNGLAAAFIADQNRAGPIIQSKIENVQALSVWISIGALVLGTLSAWVIARSITGPLRQMANQIGQGSREQNQGIGEVNMAVSQMDVVTQSNAASAEENAASSEELSAQAVTLQDIVADLQKIITGKTAVSKGPTVAQPAKPVKTALMAAAPPAKSTRSAAGRIKLDTDKKGFGIPMPEPIGSANAQFRDF